MAQTLRTIQGLLAEYGLHPKKRFGQNFLHDAQQMQRILAAAAVVPGELILEIGPGTGALSQRLLEAGAQLIAVEIDRDLEPILLNQLDPWQGCFQLIIGDALAGKHELSPQVLAALAGRPFKLVANLPYNVASPLIANLVQFPQLLLAVVMIQKEVAQRLTAPPGNKEYGALGVLVQALCHVKQVAVLSPGCFWPRPDVDSAVVRIQRREVPLTDDPAALSALLQTLFSKRRKQIGTILGRSRQLPAGIEPAARPEQLSVEQLCQLARWNALP